MKVLSHLIACLCFVTVLAHAAPGGLDALDANIVGSAVYGTAVQPDGKTIIAGSFTSVLGQPRNNVARLNLDGTLDAAFNPNANGTVLCVVVQADGKILLGGAFTSVSGTERYYIARVEANGTLDQSFRPEGVGGAVRSVAVQADGRILLGVGGDSYLFFGGIVRLASDGTLDASFNPHPNSAVDAVALQADGKILLGGGFESVGGIGRRGIARVAEDGTLDTGFNPDLNGLGGFGVNSMAIQADGNIVIGGFFSTMGGIGRKSIARLKNDGTLDLSFNPSVSSPFGGGSVWSVAVQADGKILFGGYFTTVGGIARNNIARVAANGTLDPGFDPYAFGTVNSVALQADGKILLGGDFTALGGGPGTGGGTDRLYFCRLLNDPATQSLTVPNSTQVLWTRGGSSPELEQPIFGMSSDGGATYTPLPGTCTRVGSTANWQLTGLSLPGSGRLRARGRTSGNGGSSGLVETVVNYSAPTVTLPTVTAISPAGGSTTGGTTVTITGTGFNGTTAVSIGGAAAGFAVVSPTTITAITPAHSAGTASVLVSTPGTNAHNTLYTYYVPPTVTRLTSSLFNSTTTLTLKGTGFNTIPGNNSVVFTPSGSGTVSAATSTSLTVTALAGLTVGALNAVVITNGVSSGAAVQVATVVVPVPGDLDPLNTDVIGGSVLTLAVQPDGKTIVAGRFTSVLGQPRNNIARLNADGSLDLEFNPDAGGNVNSVVVQADGKILLGGDFTTLGGIPRSRLAQLAADGTLDLGFNPNVDGTVHSLALQTDGKILLGGNFFTVGGTERNYIARVAADGTLDADFNPDASSTVLSIVVQPNGQILLGGYFLRVGGIERKYVARVADNGTLDPGFNPAASESVHSLALQADGKILLGGDFTFLGAVGRNYIARVAADGTLDAGFNPNVNKRFDSAAYSLVVQADGKILLGGGYTVGTGSNRVALVAANGSFDLAFNPNPNAAVYSLAVQADGKIFLGGEFTTVGGSSRNSLARLFNSPSTQSLTAPDTTQVLWSRGGSSPELSQVTFELSTDSGISYTPLPGMVSRVGFTANWQLTGLSLPSSGRLRARGRTTGGYGNGSSGLAETVASFNWSALEIWRQKHFGTTSNTGSAANLADPDKDGLVNLVEFAFELGPTQPSAERVPLPAITTSAAIYSFVQPLGVSGVTYGAEWSETLLPGSWTAIQDTGTTPQHIFSVPISDHPKLFTRLVVAPTP